MEEINNPTPNAEGLNIEGGPEEVDIIRKINDQAVVDNALKSVDRSGIGELPVITDPGLKMEAETEKYKRMENDLNPTIENTKNQKNKLAYQIKQKGLGRIIQEAKQALAGNQPLEKQAAMSDKYLMSLKSILGEQIDKLTVIQSTIEQNPDLLETAIARAHEDAVNIRRIALGVAIQDKMGSPNSNDYEFNLEMVNQCIENYKTGSFTIEPKHFQAAAEHYRDIIKYAQRQLRSGDADEMRNALQFNPEPISMILEASQASIQY